MRKIQASSSATRTCGAIADRNRSVPGFAEATLRRSRGWRAPGGRGGSETSAQIAHSRRCCIVAGRPDGQDSPHRVMWDSPCARRSCTAAAIHGTLRSMRLGAGAWGRLAMVPAFALVLPWQCSLVPRRDAGLLGVLTPAAPPPDAPPGRSQDPAPDPAAPAAPVLSPAPAPVPAPAVTPKQE